MNSRSMLDFPDMNTELSQAFSENPTFAAIANQVQHEREMQAVRYPYIYGIADTVASATVTPFILTIESGMDFKCVALTASAFNYDAVNATDFPIPNSAGSVDWAGRGLSMQITDLGAGRELTGNIPFELIATPGYGLNFQTPYPFRYFFARNSKIRFTITNRDGVTVPARAAHQFAIALLGYKILTPQ